MWWSINNGCCNESINLVFACHPMFYKVQGSTNIKICAQFVEVGNIYKNGSHLPFSSPPMSTKSTFATWSLSSWKEKWTGGWKTLPGYIYKRKSQGPPSPDCKEEIWKYCKQFKKKIFWKSKSFWWDNRFATGGPPTALFVSEIWPSVFFVTGRRRNWVF